MPPGDTPSPAGWYPAPEDPAQVRYWDGHRWTSSVEPRDRHRAVEGAAAPPHRSALQDSRAVGGPESDVVAAGSGAKPSKALALALLTTPALGFFLPVIGVGVSLGAALWSVGWAGALLWGPTAAAGRRLGVATVGFAALWLPALLQFSGVLYRLLGPEDSGRIGLTAWLILPLAAPENPWMPGAVAMIVYAVGAGVSALLRRPWPWVVGGVAASLAYDLTIQLASIGSIT